MLLEQLRDGEREERRHERRALLEDVAAVLDRPDDRRVRRRAADAAILERLHERRLREACRRARLVAFGLERAETSSCPTSRSGSRRSCSSSDCSSRARLVRRQEALERDHRAGRAEHRLLAGRGGGGDADRDRLPGRVLHLRRDRALPDEVVERELVAAELAAPARRACGRSPRRGGSPRAPPARS